MDNKNHFALNYPRGQVSYKTQTCNYTAKLTPTSEICALLDKKNGTISFQVDGKYKGVAFTNPDLCHSDVYFYASLDKATEKDTLKIINPNEPIEEEEEQIESENEDSNALSPEQEADLKMQEYNKRLLGYNTVMKKRLK